MPLNSAQDPVVSSDSAHNSPVPMLDLRRQYESIKDEIAAAIQRVLTSQHFIGGPGAGRIRARVGRISRRARQRWLRFRYRCSVARAACLWRRAEHQRHHYSVQLFRVGECDCPLPGDPDSGGHRSGNTQSRSSKGGVRPEAGPQSECSRRNAGAPVWPVRRYGSLPSARASV
jgi:hypothetical protein